MSGISPFGSAGRPAAFAVLLVMPSLATRIEASTYVVFIRLDDPI
jgi:hypothetical protein